MQAFKIKSGGKVLDYRRSEILDLDEVKRDLSKKFDLIDIRQPGRHVIASINKNGHECILKLASTEGIGARTKIEEIWNNEFNKYSTRQNFKVPKTIESGYYQGLYYLIVEKFNGIHLSTLRGGNNIISKHIENIIGFSEYIQGLPLKIPNEDLIEAGTAQEWFVEKTKSWYEGISPQVTKDCSVNKLLEVVEDGAGYLSEKPRHGDFTPWHIMALENGELVLIDGEHAHSHGVEYYDIAYFIQRVFSVIDRRDQAEEVLNNLKKRNCNIDKLKTVLASRAVGGFLDEYLSPVPNYEKAKEFSDFVMLLN
jgi:hypothetical protein